MFTSCMSTRYQKEADAENLQFCKCLGVLCSFMSLELISDYVTKVIRTR